MATAITTQPRHLDLPLGAPNQPVGARQNVGNDIPSAQPHLKKGSVPADKIKVLYTSCPGPKRKGDTTLRRSTLPTGFQTIKEAVAANERLGALKGFREEVIFCGRCTALHLRHIFSGELQRKSYG